MPEHAGQLGWCHGEKVRHRMFVNPQSHGIAQDEFVDPLRAQGGEFGGKHATHGVPHDHQAIAPNGI